MLRLLGASTKNVAATPGGENRRANRRVAGIVGHRRGMAQGLRRADAGSRQGGGMRPKTDFESRERAGGTPDRIPREQSAEEHQRIHSGGGVRGGGGGWGGGAGLAVKPRRRDCPQRPPETSDANKIQLRAVAHVVDDVLGHAIWHTLTTGGKLAIFSHGPYAYAVVAYCLYRIRLLIAGARWRGSCARSAATVTVHAAPRSRSWGDSRRQSHAGARRRACRIRRGPDWETRNVGAGEGAAVWDSAVGAAAR